MRYVLSALALAVVVGAAACVPGLRDRFRIDSSTDTMVLEEDPEGLRYDRNALIFSNDEFVLVGLTRDDLFTPAGIAAVSSLHASFAEIPHVASVWSIVHEPAFLFRSFKRPVLPWIAVKQSATLASPGIDLDKAREELTHHELFAQNLISHDGKTAGILVTLESTPRSQQALQKKLRLFDARGLAREGLAAAQDPAAREAATEELARAQAELDAFWPEWVESEKERKDQRIQVIKEVRARVAQAKAAGADIGLSGVPAIVVEMVEAISADLVTFLGLSAAFVFLFLAVVFRSLRWMVLPLVATGATIVFTLALMYGLEKFMTVITGNIPSLLLVIGLAHSIHFIVRYRELVARHPDLPDWERIKRTTRDLFWPCLFTATTTAAGFVSLYYAGSRPIIDFGFFMAFGVGLAFLLSFIILPGAMAVLPATDRGSLERSARALSGLGRASLRRRGLVLALSLLVMGLSVWGITRIEVEARFIDYFSPSSPIHRGLTFIDNRLGGTAGMEIVISSDEAEAFSKTENLNAAADVVAWLEQRSEVGAVMSYVGLIDEVRKVMPVLDRGRAAAALRMNFKDKPGLFAPYLVTHEAMVAGKKVLPGSRVRITARVKETDPTLRRNELLREIRAFLAQRFPSDPGTQEPGPGQPRLRAEVTGMFVLYANMLASLTHSQVTTSVLALVAIWLMLTVLFRNPFAALLGVVPNLLPITFVMGAMGWAGIPLDMATVMIASVSLGIGIDCAIHYLFRYREEVALDGDVGAAIERSHASIGTSILYTSLVSVVGFVVLVFSAFRPNAYFGLFTGFAMVAALFAMLTLLPVLIQLGNPFASVQREAAARAAVAKLQVPGAGGPADEVQPGVVEASAAEPEEPPPTSFGDADPD
ncbi:MAG: RND family transporter [Planctomycetota bacterium]